MKKELTKIMIIILVVILASVLSYFALVKTSTSLSHCLPSDIQLTDKVEFSPDTNNDAGQVTVEERLNQIHANCQNNKLVDSMGKEIYFYHQYCGGAVPDKEMIQIWEETITKLKKQYNVIVMLCNGEPAP